MNKLFTYLLLAGFAGVPCSATAVFVPTYTANFTNFFGANAQTAKNAWQAAADSFAADFSDNIHINITVDAVSDQSILGQSSQSIFSISYAALRAAFSSDATSTDDADALAGSFTAADPTGGAAFWLTRSQRIALGLLSDDGANDGTVTFGAGFNYTFSGAIGAGTIDFKDVVLHEISEIMGRIGLSGSLVGGSPAYSLLDLYSFLGPGSRALGNTSGANFSINLGATLLKAFNSGSGDTRDWLSGTNDAFNAFSSSGVTNGLSAVDLQVMDVIGYNLASATPEPSSIALMSAGLLGLIYARRRRSK